MIVTDLLPTGTAAYLELEACGGGAATKALFPAFRFRFSRLRSRAERPARSSGADALGDGGLGMAGVLDLERSTGEGSFVEETLVSIGVSGELLSNGSSDGGMSVWICSPLSWS